MSDIVEDSARGVFFLFTGNALQVVVLAVYSIVVARLLGANGFGLYSLSFVIPSILAGFVDFGVSQSITRFSAKLKSEGKNQLAANVLKAGFIFELMVGAAMSVVCFIFSNTFATYILKRPEIGLLIKLASPLILLQTVSTAMNSAFIGLDKTQGSAVIMNTQAIVKTILAPIFIVFGFGIFGAVAGHVMGQIIAVVAGSLILYKYYKGLGKSFNANFLADLKTMLSYGFPLYLSALLGLILTQSQNIILAFFVSNVEIGNFSVAVNLSSIVNLLVFPLGALFATFSKVNPNSDELKKFFKLSVKYTALLVIPAAVIVATLSKDLVYTFYGRGFSLAPAFLSFYVLTFLYSGAGSIVLGYLLLGVGETRIIFKSAIVNLLIFLPLASLLTMVYGVLGLIVASLVSGGISLAYSLHLTIKKTKIEIDYNSSIRICFASLLSTIPVSAFLYVSPFSSLFNLAISGSLFLLAYLTIIPFVGAITKTDLEILMQVFSKLRVVWPLIKPVFAYEAKLISAYNWK